MRKYKEQNHSLFPFVVTTLLLLSNITAIFRITAIFPILSTRANDVEFELLYLLENLFFFSAIWLFSFKYFQMASET